MSRSRPGIGQLATTRLIESWSSGSGLSSYAHTLLFPRGSSRLLRRAGLVRCPRSIGFRISARRALKLEARVIGRVFPFRVVGRRCGQKVADWTKENLAPERISH